MGQRLTGTGSGRAADRAGQPGRRRWQVAAGGGQGSSPEILPSTDAPSRYAPWPLTAAAHRSPPARPTRQRSRSAPAAIYSPRPLTDLGRAARPPSARALSRHNGRRPSRPPGVWGGSVTRPAAATSPLPAGEPLPALLAFSTRPSFLPSSRPPFPPLFPAAPRAGHRTLLLSNGRPPPAPGESGGGATAPPLPSPRLPSPRLPPPGPAQPSRPGTPAPTSRAAGAGPAAALTDLGARRERRPGSPGGGPGGGGAGGGGAEEGGVGGGGVPAGQPGRSAGNEEVGAAAAGRYVPPACRQQLAPLPAPQAAARG